MADQAVVTSHPEATGAGLGILEAGGTAVDAAVAAAAVLTVVDPRSTGIGGDLFAMVWEPGADRPMGLNAAGGAPARMTFEALKAQGFDAMPQVGPWSITVPGAAGGWHALLSRFGSCSLSSILSPAISLARDGASVTRVVAKEWAANVEKLRSNEAAAAQFLPGGNPPAEGAVLKNEPYAALLEQLMTDGLQSFYRPETAALIADAVEQLGGPLRRNDLQGWDRAEWVDTEAISFGDYAIHELPPPGQGLAAMVAVGVYTQRPPTDTSDAVHAAIESIKCGFLDAQRYVADPRFETVPLAELLEPSRLRTLRDEIDRQPPRRMHIGPPTDTVYLAVADRFGGACSLIQSVYDGFGSAVCVPELGIVLQNRAGCFDLVANHPNAPRPGKRPYHTIIPAMLSRQSEFAGCLGVVGGFMQPQGHLQVMRNLVELGMDPQDAVDAPRFRVMSGGRVEFEAGTSQGLLEAMTNRGHSVGELDEFLAGGAQMLLRTDEGIVVGSDRRKDGYVG